MKRPYPVAGLYIATGVLWLVSIACGAVAAFTFDASAGVPSLPTLLGIIAGFASALFAVWTGFRACRALDFLVATTR